LKNEDVIKNHLKKEYSEFDIVSKFPKWLQECHWQPTYLLETKNKKKYLAVDLLLSGTIPSFQYTAIVHKIIQKHSNFSVIIVTLEESLEDNPGIEKFCKDYGIGLKIVIRGIGVETILATSFDAKPKTKRLPLEDGWFPSAILEKAKGLKRLGFYRVIDGFIRKAKSLGNDEKKVRDLVLQTIDTLIKCHPSFTSQFGHFMKLANFEILLRLSDPDSSEHVFHSFRVFLAGCPVINEFYDRFKNSQIPLCKMDRKKLKIEYVWMLTSIFHDIGRRKEAMPQLVSAQIGDEDIEVSIQSKDSRWTKGHNIIAKRVLGSLGAFIANAKKGEEWDGGTIDDEDSEIFTSEWIRNYTKMKSHGVISAFDFLGDLFEKAMASDERKHRPFIITHAVPAAMSMLLHDWKIWPEMTQLKLIPVNMPILPMAALLIYIDTWDNYKRKGNDPLTYIKEYSIDSTGACVNVEWGNMDLMKKDEVGYIAYKKALKNLLFALDIEYGMA
jgi:hypothetical protein